MRLALVCFETGHQIQYMNWHCVFFSIHNGMILVPLFHTSCSKCKRRSDFERTEKEDPEMRKMIRPFCNF